MLSGTHAHKSALGAGVGDGRAAPGLLLTCWRSAGAYGRPPQTFQGWYTVYYNMLQPHEMQEVRAWFQAIDVDRSGHITANEVQKCTFANVPLGFDTAAKLVRVFDKDRSGSIDFYELSEGRERRRCTVVDLPFFARYAAMHKFLSLMQHAFFQGDTDRSGRLDAREIHTALGVGRMTVGMPAVNAL